jgi:Tol biopolymer transport system component/DNA-binding winged helix-turn-helix (wHTH) protein
LCWFRILLVNLLIGKLKISNELVRVRFFPIRCRNKDLEKRRAAGCAPLRAAELLLVFLKEPRKILTKEELLKRTWGNTYVEDGNLTYQVFVIRKALGHSPSGEPYIENLKKRGYRFTAPVREYQPTLVEVEAPFSPTEHRAASGARLSGSDALEAQLSKAAQASWHHRVIYGIFAFAAVVALALIAVLGPYVASPSRISVVEYVPLTNDGQEKLDEPLLTDGARVYFIEKQPNGNVLASVAVGGSKTGLIPLPPGFERFYDLYPQTYELLAGKLASDQLGPELWSVPLLGPPPRRISNLRADSASWSPGEDKIAFTLHNDLYVANADGSGSRKIAQVSGDASLPRWSSDGKLLRFTEGLPQDGEAFHSIWEVGADGSNLHRLLSGWNHPPGECCGVWTPDAKFFIFQSLRKGRNDLWSIRERSGFFGTESESPVGLSSGAPEFFAPLMSADGKQAFAIGTVNRGELVRYDLRLKEFVPFLGGIPATWVCFSKSGHSVAYVDYRDKTVWRANADGSQKTQITFPPMEADGLAWSPDEKTLAFRGLTPGKRPVIYSVPSSGGDVSVVFPSKTEQGIPTWSDDGDRIAFGDVPPVYGKALGGEAIHILELRSHALTELPNSRGLWSSRWSPDGRYLSALTINGQLLKLYDFKEKKWRSTEAEAVENATWSSDSRYIYFNGNSRGPALFRLRAADRHVDLLISLKTYPNLAVPWSGVAPDNSPLILRNLGNTEVYSLALTYR